jgi:hypothetical protein
MTSLSSATIVVLALALASIAGCTSTGASGGGYPSKGSRGGGWENFRADAFSSSTDESMRLWS